jgi:hypothetical protein
MANPIVEKLEKHILPRLEQIATQLRRDFPHIEITTWSSATGSAVTDNPWHDMGIDCMFPDAPPDEANNVALLIGCMQINCNPRLSDLCVCWGAGARASSISVDLLAFPIPWTSNTIDEIKRALPTLFETLIAALQNPYPPELSQDPTSR